MRTKKNQKLVLKGLRTVLFLSSFVFSFLFGASTNLSRFTLAAEKLNEALLEDSSVNYLNLNAVYNSKNFNYPSLQTSISKKSNAGWPDNCFKELPIYNLQNDLKVSYKSDLISGNDPILIANSNWGIHKDQNGTTMDSYYFSLMFESANASSKQSTNFCYVSQPLAEKLQKDRNIASLQELIDSPIVLSFGGSDYQLNISNIVLPINDIYSNVANLFGDDFFLLNQDESLSTFFTDLHICLFLNQPISSLTIVDFLNQLKSDDVTFDLQEQFYSGKHLISNKASILKLLNQSYLLSVPKSIVFLASSICLFVLSFFLPLKNESNRFDDGLFASSFVVSFLIFLILRYSLSNSAYFSFPAVILCLVYAVSYCFVVFLKRRKKPSMNSQENTQNDRQDVKG
jgi:hypothetical protein